jgi:hypothetical protein
MPLSAARSSAFLLAAPRFNVGRGSVLAVFSNMAFAILLIACGGGNGDAPAAPLGNEYGDGARIAELVGEAHWLDPADKESERCSQPPDRRVYITGATLVAIDRFDETGEGARGNFYVQDSADEPAEHSGMTVFRPSFSPPDLRLVPGDVVDLLGVLTEFLGPSVGRFGQCRTLPEIGGTMSFRFENGRVEPKLVPLEALTSYESARKYVGMLVRVEGEGVSIAGAPTSSAGRYAASINVGEGVSAEDVPKISNDLYDLEADGPPLADGATFHAITGVLTYFYGFKIAPRSPDDFEP